MAELFMMASCRKEQKKISAESSVIPPPSAPQIGQGTELNCLERWQLQGVVEQEAEDAESRQQTEQLVNVGGPV